MVKCRVLCRVYMFFCSLVYMYSEESENSFGWAIPPLWGERSWVGVGRARFMFSKLWFKSGGDSHQVWWRHTLGHAETDIKFCGCTRWVRRWHTSSLVEASVKFDGGRTMVIVIIRRFDSVVLFGCRLFFGRCPLLCFRFVSLCFRSVLLYFCSMLLCFCVYEPPMV